MFASTIPRGGALPSPIALLKNFPLGRFHLLGEAIFRKPPSFGFGSEGVNQAVKMGELDQPVVFRFPPQADVGKGSVTSVQISAIWDAEPLNRETPEGTEPTEPPSPPLILFSLDNETIWTTSRRLPTCGRFRGWTPRIVSKSDEMRIRRWRGRGKIPALRAFPFLRASTVQNHGSHRGVH